MSKASKLRERAAKIARKKAMQKANMAQQDNYRLKKHNKKKKRHTTSHPYGQCGNIGCKRCNPAKLSGAERLFDELVIKQLTGKEQYLERIKRNKK